jgi:YVTN family beta-propeller protein
MKSLTMALAIASTLAISSGKSAERSLFLLERKIPLGEVRGRVDHLAVDLKRGRLFVAELENDTVAVIDLDAHKVTQVISGLKKPQGLAYHAPTDSLYVANGGDGTVAIFAGDNYLPVTRIQLGDDADNIRVDEFTNEVFVAYGNGALAIVDPMSRTKIGDVGLKAHPESFQIHRSTSRIFLNDPTNESVVVVDLAARKQVTAWPTGNGSHFPMALNEKAGHVVVAFRKPTRLGAFSMKDGAPVANVDLCGDADDMFIDTKRERVYVSCGEGFFDVFDARDDNYLRIGRIATVVGARTSLFVPELDLVFVAARATSTEPATLWVLRPNFASEESIP